MSAAKSKLLDPVTKIPYVGQSVALKLSNLGVKNVEDLFYLFPRNIIDLTKTISISSVFNRLHEKVIIEATVTSSSLVKTPRRRMWLTSALLTDDSGSIEAVWFNQPYLKKSLKIGEKLLFYGEVSSSPAGKITFNSPEIFSRVGVYPVYSQTRNLSTKQISKLIGYTYKSGYDLDEFLPDNVLKKYRLIGNESSAKELHFPTTSEKYFVARQRLILNKLLFLMLANMEVKKKLMGKKAPKIVPDPKIIKKFSQSLGFELTGDQKTAIDEIMADFARLHPMNRLLQGDVGSGKTVVALIASLVAIRSGYNAVWLAPTVILARQHFETAKKFLKGFGVDVELIISGGAKLTEESNNPRLIIGTHKLLSQKSNPKNIGLVVVDEQHRFGVNQRAQLEELNHDFVPHFLSLSATPIPRTLGHIIYGNLDISIIKEKPMGRIEIKTFFTPEKKRDDSYKFIDGLIAKGQQVFVICPLIEASDDVFDDRKAVQSEVENLRRTVLGHRRIEALHGRMKSAEKQEIMQRMQKGEIDILVATSVVEVGVDVKAATVMVIEEAEKFGLAQLHQFRGRVGRSDLQSYCFIYSKNLENEKSRERLKAFIQNSDGFKLAEMDLKQRGPGALLGEKQSGFTDLNPLWFEDSQTLKTASDIAKEIFADYKKNEYLCEKVKTSLTSTHLE